MDINLYLVDSAIGFLITYPLDSDLTDGWRYLPFEQLGPVLQGKNLLVTLKQAKWALRVAFRKYRPTVGTS